jgi:hypothetical protein
MLGRAARLHYQHGYTHQQIAETLGVSRVKVTRMLAEARRTGIVEIRIHSDETIFTDLEVALARSLPPDERLGRAELRGPGPALRLPRCARSHRARGGADPGDDHRGRSVRHRRCRGTPRADRRALVRGLRARHRAAAWRRRTDPAARGRAGPGPGLRRHRPAPARTGAGLQRRGGRAPAVGAGRGAGARARPGADIAIYGIGGMLPGSGILMDGTAHPLADQGAGGRRGGRQHLRRVLRCRGTSPSPRA